MFRRRAWRSGDRAGAEGTPREKTALDALDDLAAHLDGMALGRTVVVVVSDGWRLFSENRG